MQPFAKTSTLGTAYSDAQVQGFFIAQSLQEDWRFSLLDRNLNVTSDLTKFAESGTAIVKHDATMAVKRALTINVTGSAPISSLSQAIQPVYKLKAPDGGWLEWSLGIFPLVPYEADIYPYGTWYQIQASDLTQLLVDAKLLHTYTARAGDNYIHHIQALVSSYGGAYPLRIQIPDSGFTLQAPFTWQPGTEILTAINELLSAINYWPLWVDERGIFRSSPIPDFDRQVPSYAFDTTTGSSIVGIPIRKKPDYAKIFNIGQVVVEDPRLPSYAVNYINNNDANPVSTTNWRPKLRTHRKSHINRAQAQQIARSLVQYSSMLYDVSEVPSLPWPLSQDYDFYRLRYKTPDLGLVDSAYVSTGWEHNCKKGEHTVHTLARLYPTAGYWG